MPFLRSFEQLTYTAIADTLFSLTLTDKWYNYCDIFVTGASAYLGDVTAQTALITLSDIYTIPTPVNIKDLFFKNAGAGVNTTITIIGTLMTQKQVDDSGIQATVF